MRRARALRSGARRQVFGVVGVRGREDLVSIVERFVPLQVSGTKLVGLCPFHQETEPSFKVDPSTQRWKCWGCGAWGDARDFLRSMGQPMPHGPLPGPIKAEPLVMTAAMASAVGAAAGMYVRALDAARPAQRYLKARGFQVQRFPGTFGFAPGAGRTVALLRHVGLEDAGLAAGILADGRYGRHDVLGGRVVFIERRGSVAVYLIGRSLHQAGGPGAQSSPRYLYLRPRAPVYGIEGALNLLARCRGEAWCLVVEGVTDALALQQLGAPAVAVLGCEPSPERLREVEAGLPSHVRLAVLGDSDHGGEQLARRVSQRFGERVLRLPSLRAVSDPAGLLLLGVEARDRVLRAVLAAGGISLEEMRR